MELKHFAPLIDIFDYSARKSLALYILTNAIENETKIGTAEQTDAILTMASTLITDQSDEPSTIEDPEDFAEEQGVVARFIHLLEAEEPDIQYLMLSTVRKHVGTGGVKRIRYTLPPIVFRLFDLAEKYKSVNEEDQKWEKKCSKIFQMCHQTISVLIKAETVELAELSLRLFLQVCNYIFSFFISLFYICTVNLIVLGTFMYSLKMFISIYFFLSPTL